MKARSLIDAVKVRSVIVALAAAAAGLGLAVAAGAHGSKMTATGPSASGTATSVTSTTTTGGGGGSGGIPRNQRTHPSVSPVTGDSSTSFELSFTLRQTPGHHGVVATDYRVEVAPYRGSASSCWPPQPSTISGGQAGTVVKLALAPPAGGWCVGRYRVTVFLERGPYCPPPQPHPQPCPEFATQELDTGHTHFLIDGTRER